MTVLQKNDKSYLHCETKMIGYKSSKSDLEKALQGYGGHAKATKTSYKSSNNF